MQQPFIEFLPAALTPAVIEHSLDYSGGAADVAVLTPDAGFAYYEVDELTIDGIASMANISYASWFGAAALSPGISIKVKDVDGVEVADLTDGNPIVDFGTMFRGASGPIAAFLMDQFTPDRWHIHATWEFERPIILRAGEKIEITLGEDLTDPLLLYFIAKGRKYS